MDGLLRLLYNLKAKTQRNTNGSSWMAKSLDTHNGVCPAINYRVLSKMIWVVPQL